MDAERKCKRKSLMLKIGRTVFAISFLIGFAILVYPYVADQWNTMRQRKLITTYKEAVSEQSNEDTLEGEWAAARAYNETIMQSDVYADVFDSDNVELEDTDYWQVLNLKGDGMMGYISIPKINLMLPIYHGTSDEVLNDGVGHISGSQLPIGGESNHAVLAAHRGLATSKLFTDIDQLEIGDQFYLYILDEVLAYEVDQILTMVDKDDEETISAALATVEGEDYVTLFTCTPYGVNSHRLLVRGHRVEYVPDEEEPTIVDNVVDSVRTYYMFYLIGGMVITAVAIFVIRLLRRRKARMCRGDESEQ